MATLLSPAGKPTQVRRLLLLRWHRPSLLATVHKLHQAERQRQRAQEEQGRYYRSWIHACRFLGYSF